MTTITQDIITDDIRKQLVIYALKHTNQPTIEYTRRRTIRHYYQSEDRITVQIPVQTILDIIDTAKDPEQTIAELLEQRFNNNQYEEDEIGTHYEDTDNESHIWRDDDWEYAGTIDDETLDEQITQLHVDHYLTIIEGE